MSISFVCLHCFHKQQTGRLQPKCFRLHRVTYTSIAFGNRCQEMGVRPSMGSVGDAYDNAMAESFFATLECELIARRKWETKAQARLAIFTWIEAWYNPRRRHSGLGQMSPNNFEQRHQENRQEPAEKPLTPITTAEPNALASRQQDGLLSGCFAPTEQACTGDNHHRPHPIRV